MSQFTGQSAAPYEPAEGPGKSSASGPARRRVLIFGGAAGLAGLVAAGGFLLLRGGDSADVTGTVPVHHGSAAPGASASTTPSPTQTPVVAAGRDPFAVIAEASQKITASPSVSSVPTASTPVSTAIPTTTATAVATKTTHTGASATHRPTASAAPTTSAATRPTHKPSPSPSSAVTVRVLGVAPDDSSAVVRVAGKTLTVKPGETFATDFTVHRLAEERIVTMSFRDGTPVDVYAGTAHAF
jgi:hypothetical protein